MSFNLRFVVCTYNLWNGQRWPERQEPLRQFITYHYPDILGVQELHPEVHVCLQTALPNHQYINDLFPGWQNESNIYWNSELFKLIEFGTVEIGQFEPLRRLFWVRLDAYQAPPLLVATAHYTWQGHDIERTTGLNPRLEQARQTVTALNNLASPDDAVLFMGDLNDFLHPLRILRDGGFIDSFSALGRVPSGPSWPARPIWHEVPEFDDWICHRGPLQPMTSEIVDFFVNDLTPSDHKPLIATYRFV